MQRKITKNIISHSIINSSMIKILKLLDRGFVLNSFTYVCEFLLSNVISSIYLLEEEKNISNEIDYIGLLYGFVSKM